MRNSSDPRAQGLVRTTVGGRSQRNKVLERAKIGARYGRLTVLAFWVGSRGAVRRYECQCVCGTVVFPGAGSFESGASRSCNDCAKSIASKTLVERGTSRKYPEPKIGLRYGPYRIIRRTRKTGRAAWVYIGECVTCGTHYANAGWFFNSTKATECLECRRQWGGLSTRDAEHAHLYTRFTNMHKRCRPGHYAGDKGVRVCDRWFDFRIFAKDCKELPGYAPGPNNLELDRRDNGGNYSPENCRFVTQQENLKNR